MTFEGRNGQFTWQEAFGDDEDDDDECYGSIFGAASSRWPCNSEEVIATCDDPVLRS
jgi:hypothetical protein